MIFSGVNHIHGVKNQVIHILLQSYVVNSVQNKPHCPLTPQITPFHTCMHAQTSFLGVTGSRWGCMAKVNIDNTQIFQVKYTFSTSTPTQHVTFQNQTQSSPTE